MAWIESHQSLGTHRKTWRLSSELGIDMPTTVGHLHLMWWWCLDNASDGSLSHINAAILAKGARWEGDPDQFLNALVSAGFVDKRGKKRVVYSLHDWMDYAGRLLELRKQHAEKTRRQRLLYNDHTLTRCVRARDGNKCRYCGVDVNWRDRKGRTGGTYDHIDPDGPNDEANIVVACRHCNSVKNRRSPEQAGLQLIPVDSPQIDSPEIHRESAITNRTNQPYQPTNSDQPTPPPPTGDDGGGGGAEHRFEIIASLFEQEIGKITPILEKEIRSWAELYPSSWVEKAILIAVANKKPTLAYVRGVLKKRPQTVEEVTP